MVALAEYLASRYAAGEERVTALLDNTEIHIAPTLNPDGFERKTLFGQSIRENAHNKDLNRAFPTWEQLGNTREELLRDREPEVRAAVEWILDNPFVLSINFHDGAVVANYPWDQANTRPWERSAVFTGRPSGPTNLTPDSAEFESLARQYAARHATMSDPAKVGSCPLGTFQHGVTNGVDWYEVIGGMQDFNYLYSNCMEITVELSCTKKPPASKLQGEWENNRDSLLTYLEQGGRAVRGLVTDEAGQPLPGAAVRVEGRMKDVLTSEEGEYWRVLVPGRYRLKAVAGDRESEEVEVLVKEGEAGREGPTVNLQLTRYHSYKFGFEERVFFYNGTIDVVHTNNDQCKNIV